MKSGPASLHVDYCRFVRVLLLLEEIKRAVKGVVQYHHFHISRFSWGFLHLGRRLEYPKIRLARVLLGGNYKAHGELHQDIALPSKVLGVEMLKELYTNILLH